MICMANPPGYAPVSVLLTFSNPLKVLNIVQLSHFTYLLKIQSDCVVERCLICRKYVSQKISDLSEDLLLFNTLTCAAWVLYHDKLYIILLLKRSTFDIIQHEKNILMYSTKVISPHERFFFFLTFIKYHFHHKAQVKNSGTYVREILA